MTRKSKRIIVIALGMILLCVGAASLFIDLLKNRGLVVVSGKYALFQSPLGGKSLVNVGSDAWEVIVPENVTVIKKSAKTIMGLCTNEGTSSKRRIILIDTDKNTFFGNLPPKAYFEIDVLEHRIKWFRDPACETIISDLPESVSGHSIPIRIEIK